MNSNVMRVVAGIAVVAVAVVLLIVLKDDGSDGGSDSAGGATTGREQPTGGGPSTQNALPTIVVKGGKPVGGVRDLTYEEGDQIRFKVESDVSDEIHVHGYDIAKDVEAGGSVQFDFPADIEGVFEAELESRGEQILELTVNP